MSVLIIAEIGINHNGSEQEAYRLVDAAIAAKADVAKFQLYKPELLTDDIGKLEMLHALLLPKEAYIRLYHYCKGRIGFACTAFDVDSLEYLLANTDMAFVKISSGQWDNKELLAYASQAELPVIQSVKKGGLAHPGWRYLWVVPEYPTPPQNACLKVVKESWCSGLSDHSGDIFMPLAAVALGAQIIECHLTADKNQDGPDHAASLTPVQFTQMVRGIRAIEKALT